MNERVIKCGTNRELHITEREKSECMKIVLVDNKNIPIARYEFNGEKFKNHTFIKYKSNETRKFSLILSPSCRTKCVLLETYNIFTYASR